MPSHPLFSVVVPCYNAQSTLAETLRSVQAQTLQDWELIAVDDGSGDQSPDIVADFAAGDPRIRLQRGAHLGVSCARNTGIKAAKGRYLAFLDADDLWHPDKLALHADHFAQSAATGVSFARVRFMTPEGRHLPQVSAVPRRGLDAFSLLTENHISTSSNIVARRELFSDLGGFQEHMSFAEDQEWLFRAALNGRWRVAGIPQTLVYYRTSPGSLSSDLRKMEDGWLAMLEKVNQYAPDFLRRHRSGAQAIYFRQLARRSLRQGDPAEIGLAYLQRAWRSSAAALLRQPQRSFLTLAGLMAWRLAPRLTDRYFLHLQ